VKRQPQRDERDADRERDRQPHDRRRIVTERRESHCRHADVVHRRNAGAQEDAADAGAEEAHALTADDEQRDAGREHCRKE
jgi:hypothetical protein